MLNYKQRLQSYELKSYYQVNEGYLDVYAKKLPEWYQKLDVIKDVLTHASNVSLQNNYDILFVRLFGGDISKEMVDTFIYNLGLANRDLAITLGVSDYWKKIRLDSSVEDRHFAAITVSSYKPTIVEAKPVESTELVANMGVEVIQPIMEEDDEPRRKKHTRKQESSDSESI